MRVTGHRQYLDNPKLVRTIVRKAPVPKGHRSFIAPLRAIPSGRSGLLRTEPSCTVSALREPAAIAGESA